MEVISDPPILNSDPPILITEARELGTIWGETGGRTGAAESSAHSLSGTSCTSATSTPPL